MAKHGYKRKKISRDKVYLFWKQFVRAGKGGVREYDKNSDVISIEESNARIIYFQLIFAFLASFIAAILATSCYSESSKTFTSQPYVDPEEVQTVSNKVIISQLVVIYDNATIILLEFDNYLNIIKTTKLLDLPKSKRYFGFYYKGILHVFFNDFTRKVTKYHPKLNKEGHTEIPKSGIADFIDTLQNNWVDTKQFTYGIQVGDKFWMMGRRLNHATFNAVFDHNSYIWYHKRQIWREGPQIHSSIHDYFCATALNSSHVIIIGGYLEKGVNQTNQRRTFLYNFLESSYSEYPSLELDFQDNMFHCSATLYFEKEYSRHIVVQTTVQTILPNHVMREFIRIYSYELKHDSNGTWKKLLSFPASTQTAESQIYFARGALFMFVNPRRSRTIGYQFDFSSVPNQTDSQRELRFPSDKFDKIQTVISVAL